MVDGDYVGDAPLTHSITYDGGFPSFYYFQIEAVPKPDWGTGMFVQERVVKPPTIPSRLFFDMRLRPVYPAQPIDANVNVRGQN